MNDTRKSVALVIAITVIGVLGFVLLPFKAAGGLRCEAPLRGGDPKERATQGYLVGREEVACANKNGSRLAIAGVMGLVYLVVGTAAVVLPESNIERVVFGGEDPEEVYEGD